MRPLDRLPSIKMKLGVVIVASVAGTVLLIVTGVRAGLPKWATGIAACVAALAVVQFLARGMTSPLREMARAATAMARGDYTRRVTATSRAEVGDLARAFNSMAGELAEVDRMRRDLVANVSHELRTPISALQAVLENLVDGVARADRQTLDVMIEQVARLRSLVDQLLELSRLESGTVPLERRRFLLAPVLEQAARDSDLGAGAQEKQVQVDVDVDPLGLEIDADPERVLQLVANLLRNAVRHSPSGGGVTVAATSADAHVRIEVVDEGPGIPEEEAARVFERFYRADAARSLDDGGAGLGLAISRWIVELHGGSIRVDQAAPTGCRMVVELPRSSGAA